MPYSEEKEVWRLWKVYSLRPTGLQKSSSLTTAPLIAHQESLPVMAIKFVTIGRIIQALRKPETGHKCRRGVSL